MTVKITSKQEVRLSDLFGEALRELGFSKDEAQEIIKNGGALKAQVTPILQKLAMVDQRFGRAVSDFTFIVPSGYEHDQQIDQFAAKKKGLKTTYHYNDALTSANFAKATSKLLPGKTYCARIFPILKEVSSDDCLTFLRKQKSIFVGGQGVTLIQDLRVDEFPAGQYTVSFAKHFEISLEKNGIVHFHTYPRSPKMNAEIERFNRTLSDAFISQSSTLGL